MLRRQRVGSGQIGNRAGDLEHAVVTAGREPQACHGRGEQALGLGGDRTEASNLARAHRGVDAGRAGAEAVTLLLASALDPRPDRLAGVARGQGVNLAGQERGELDVQVDAVEERTGQAAEVSGAPDKALSAP